MKEILETPILLIENNLDDDFYTAIYQGEEITVRLNDFPDEILYTVFYRDESLDLEGLPDNWKIQYING